MKKIISLIAIAIFCLTPLQAQDFNFGLKAGVNFASISGDDTDDLESLTGFHVGVVGEYMFSESFGFQPELLYSTQGAKQEESGEESELKLNYINLPLLAKYKFSEAFSLHVGPQVGFLTTAEADVPGMGTVDLKENMKSVDFGLAAGLGYQMDMGVFFNARYNLGLSNINDTELDDFSNQNSVIQLSLGYMF